MRGGRKRKQPEERHKETAKANILIKILVVRHLNN